MTDAKAIEPVGDLEPIQPKFKRQDLTPSVWRMINEIAPVAWKSRLFGVTSAEAAAAIMLKGYELGLGITTAFEYINVIQGRTSLKPIGSWALVLNSGELETSRIIDENDANNVPFACSVYLKRKNGMEYTIRVTMEDAMRSGVVKEGSGWATYPANMLRWRALGFAIDAVFPDVQGGMKRSDEFGATVDADGNVVEASWTEIPAHTAYTQPSEAYPGSVVDPGLATSQDPEPTVGIQDLIDTYGAEPVLQAITKVTQGAMPDNQDQINDIAKELEDGRDTT
jgi:hypothetical protein